MTKMVNEINSRSLKHIGALYNVLNLAEYIIEELECEAVYVRGVDYREDHSRITLYCVGCRYGDRSGDIDLYIRDLKESFNIDIDIVPKTVVVGNPGLGIEELYRYIASLVKESSSEILKRYAYLTQSRRGIEYLLLILSNGKGVVLEGEYHKVEIPYVRNIVATVHTHPSGYCIPSRQDVETCLLHMGDGGLLCGVVTVSCDFYIYLTNVLDEDSFRSMMKIVNGYDRFASEIIRKLNNREVNILAKAGNIVFEVTGPHFGY